MKVDEAFREFLREQPFVILCVGLDLGRGNEAVLLVKSDRDLLGRLREAGVPARVGLVVEATDHGPVVCMGTSISRADVGEVAGETYFDVSAPEDRELLANLGRQETLRIAFLDEEVAVVGMAEEPWGELHRLEAQQILDRAEELLERSAAYDFEEAKVWFQEQVPLDRLLERMLQAV